MYNDMDRIQMVIEMIFQVKIHPIVKNTIDVNDIVGTGFPAVFLLQE